METCFLPPQPGGAGQLTFCGGQSLGRYADHDPDEHQDQDDDRRHHARHDLRLCIVSHLLQPLSLQFRDDMVALPLFWEHVLCTGSDIT